VLLVGLGQVSWLCVNKKMVKTSVKQW